MRTKLYLFSVAILTVVAIACNSKQEVKEAVGAGASCNCGFDTLTAGNESVIIKSLMSFETSTSDYLIVFDADFTKDLMGYDSTIYDTDSVNKVVKITLYFSKSSANNGTKLNHKTIPGSVKSFDYEIWINVDGQLSKNSTRQRPIAAVNGTVPFIPTDTIQSIR